MRPVRRITIVRILITLLLAPATLRADASLPGSETWQERCARLLTIARDELVHESLPLEPIRPARDGGVAFGLATSYGQLTVDVGRWKWPNVKIARELDGGWSEDHILDTHGLAMWGMTRIRAHADERTHAHVHLEGPPGFSIPPDALYFTRGLRNAIDVCLDGKPVVTSLDGRYRVTGAVARDTCGGRLVFATQNLTVDLANGKMVADVVNRVYEARVEGGVLKADFAEPSLGACTGVPMIERWSLQRSKDGSLGGELVSMWPLPPDCPRRCEVVFAIRATPIAGGQ